MFFVLSKLLDVLLSPLSWAMGLVALGLFRQVPAPLRGLLSRLPASPLAMAARAWRWLPAAGLGVLYLFSIEPVSNALWKALEAPPLTSIKPDVVYDAVIVLGGMIDDRAMAEYGRTEFNENVDRLLAGRDLLAENKARYVLLSGGDGNPQGGEHPEAQVLQRQLIAWGVDPARIVIEDRSRNTRENAVESARIVRERGWRSLLLVTSAFHMPRSLGCFRAVGLEPDTLSVDFRASTLQLAPASFLPRAGALDASTAALREFFGRVVYRARGFAAPV